MITRLIIKNFTLIDSLDIEFHPGFSVITGETGAGKSIILGAIGLLMGQRADSKSIRGGADRCVIEAHFDLSKYNIRSIFEENDLDYEDECIIRRELTASGKSRSFVNDTPAPLNVLKILSEHLLDIHSQHQNLLINKDDFQLNVVDIIAENKKILIDYKENYHNYQKALRELEEVKEQIEANKKNYDFIKFQYNELNDANLQPGELDTLEQKSKKMAHSEDIKTALYSIDDAMNNDNNGILTALKNAVSSLDKIKDVMPDAIQLEERINSCNIELKDVSQEIARGLESVDFDPAEADMVNSRIDKLYNLLQKYSTNTIDELIEKREQLKNELNIIDNGEGKIEELQAAVDSQKKKCTLLAEKLSKARHDASKKIEKEMVSKLKPLGLPNVKFKVDINKKEISADGYDQVQFLFSANPGGELRPVSQIASGGEIARVMLTLKAMISGTIKLPTIIFDEIDTGVSGKIAEQMGIIMKEMGNSDRQVISITHLPQIAAKGTTHYKVFKEQNADDTNSRMVMISGEERVQEIAQMLSGSEVTDAAINNAKELLATK